MPLSTAAQPPSHRTLEASLRAVADHLPDDPAEALTVLVASFVMVAGACGTDSGEGRDLIVQALDEAIAASKAIQSRDGSVWTAAPSPRDAVARWTDSVAASPEEPSPGRVRS